MLHLFLLNLNLFSVPQPQAYQVMQPQMPPNPFLGAARGMMQPPLPPVRLHYLFSIICCFLIFYFYFSLE